MPVKVAVAEPLIVKASELVDEDDDGQTVCICVLCGRMVGSISAMVRC